MKVNTCRFDYNLKRLLSSVLGCIAERALKRKKIKKTTEDKKYILKKYKYIYRFFVVCRFFIFFIM